MLTIGNVHIVVWQAILFFILGGLLGQRFAHLHPIGSVRQANGGE
jgi:hypothetical protein